MPYLELEPGRSIFYTDEGSGDDAVLMIHGWTCDGSDWSWLVADLAVERRCIAVDLRGHGRSSPASDGYTPRLCAADCAAVIERLGLERPVVIGHSMGTIVASALAVERPDLVRALVLVDPVYGADDDGLAPVLAAIRDAPHAVATAAFGQFYVADTPQWLRVWHRRRILGTDEAVVRDALLHHYEGEQGLGRKVIGASFLPRRQAPVLAVYAGMSAATAEWDRSLAHGPSDEIVVWSDNGHFLHQEDPARFSTEVRRWLGGLATVGSDEAGQG